MSAKKANQVLAGEPVVAECNGLKVNLPGRHVPAEVLAAARAFAGACGRYGEVYASAAAAQQAVHATRNQIIGEAYRALSEDAVIDEDAKLRDSEDFAAVSHAEQAADAHLQAARQLVETRYHETAHAVRVAGEEWSAYLRTQLDKSVGRITAAMAEVNDALLEMQELEGFLQLIQRGGTWGRQQRIEPVEVGMRGKVRVLQDQLDLVHDLANRTHLNWTPRG
jgi:hypothetical protein